MVCGNGGVDNSYFYSSTNRLPSSHDGCTTTPTMVASSIAIEAPDCDLRSQLIYRFREIVDDSIPGDQHPIHDSKLAKRKTRTASAPGES